MTPHYRDNWTVLDDSLPAVVGSQRLDTLLDESASARLLLTSIYDNHARCPRCHETVRPSAVDRFWRGDRFICHGCRQKVSAWEGTGYPGKLSAAQIVTIAALTYYNTPLATIAKAVGVKPDTVKAWTAKFAALAEAHRA